MTIHRGGRGQFVLCLNVPTYLLIMLPYTYQSVLVGMINFTVVSGLQLGHPLREGGQTLGLERRMRRG